MTTSSTSRPAPRSLLLTAVLFVSYLCVGIALPIVPLHVTASLGLGNACAGLGVGIAFLATVLSRGHAGSLSDRRGAKVAVVRGLAFYVAGALVSAASGLPMQGAEPAAFAILLAGRLLSGLGESLVAVGVISWGIALAGVASSGRVLALVGAAIYGAVALGAPVGVVLLERWGFAGALAASAMLPGAALLAVWPMRGIAPQAGAQRPSFARVVGDVWRHGVIVCLQGIGFAAIGAFFTLHFVHRHWAHAGLGLAAFGGGFVLVRALCSGLPDRLGGLPVAIASLAVETLGQLLIWRAGDPALALCGAFLTGLGCSMIFPAMGREVVRLVPPHLRGTALGAFAAFQDVAYGLTGPLAGLLADRAGVGSVFAAGAAAAAAGLALAWGLRRGGAIAQAA